MNRIIGLCLVVGLAYGEQPKAAAKTDINIMSAGDTDHVRQLFAHEIIKLNPDIPTATLEANYDNYMKTLPGVQGAFAQKTCAGKSCSTKVVNQALIDTYVVTVQERDYGFITPKDIGDTVGNSSYVAIWSEPTDADFRLLAGTIPIWADKTDNERFVLKGEYRLHIEKTGYETFDATCSNRRNEGTSCGGKLKKKP